MQFSVSNNHKKSDCNVDCFV